MENWLTITGFEDYEVSDIGRIRSKDKISTDSNKFRRLRNPIIKGKIITQQKSEYMMVKLSNGIEFKNLRVHRLVALMFVPNPLNKPVVNHKNGKKYDNWKDNLEWNTEAENDEHARIMGLKVAFKGEKSSNVKLNEKHVLEIRSKFVRYIYPSSKLAVEYDVSKATIKDIVYRISWTHI